jgi:hypothetical protein
MASGVTSGAWGYSMPQMAFLNNKAEYGNVPLTYQLGLTSTPVDLPGSPLLNANTSFYSVVPTNVEFGKKNKNLKKKLLKEIRYLKSSR